MSVAPAILQASCTFISKGIVTVPLLLCLVACGLVDPKFENYEGGGISPGGGLVDPNSECGKTAVAAFDTNMKPAVESVCAIAGCHASGAGAAKLQITSGDSLSNRANIYAYTGFDRSKLTAYIGGGSHGGGNKASELPEAKVTAWLDVEEGCSQSSGG